MIILLKYDFFPRLCFISHFKLLCKKNGPFIRVGEENIDDEEESPNTQGRRHKVDLGKSCINLEVGVFIDRERGAPLDIYMLVSHQGISTLMSSRSRESSSLWDKAFNDIIFIYDPLDMSDDPWKAGKMGATQHFKMA